MPVIVSKANNMRIISYAVIVVFVAILSFSCRKEGTWAVRGQGSNETESREVMGFDGIKLCTDAEVYYVKDSIYKVEVDAQKNIRAIITTDLQGGDLVIKNKRRIGRANKVTITVHAPHMKRLSISGSGNINSKSTINESDLSLNISGSGNISVPTMTVQTLNTKISGSGCIKTENGNVDNAYHSISGSGHVGAEYVKSKIVDANISGSGNITVTATSKLKANISGSGKLSYHGNPSVNADVSGSGKIVALD